MLTEPSNEKQTDTSVSSTSIPVKEKCPIHKKKLNYYCLDCKKELCQHCVILERHPQLYPEHLIVQNEFIKEGLVKDIFKQAMKVGDILKGMDETLPDRIEEKLNKLKKEKEDTVNFYKELGKSLEKRYDEVINELTMLKTNFTQQMNNFQIKKTKSREIIYDVSYQPPEKRKWKDNQIKEFLSNKGIQITPENFIKFCNSVNAVINPLTPSFEFSKFTYELKNYNDVLTKREPSNEMLSTPLYIVNFLSWQLHVYPWGGSTGRDKFLSVYIGLIEGDENEEYNYSYKIELENFKTGKAFDTDINVKPFKAKGKFYGCEKLYLISELEKNGFINEKGSIMINVYIKPNSIDELKKEIKFYNSKNVKKANI